MEVTANITGTQDKYNIIYISNEGQEESIVVEQKNITEIHNLTGLKPGTTYNISVRSSSYGVLSAPHLPIVDTTCMYSAYLHFI